MRKTSASKGLEPSKRPSKLVKIKWKTKNLEEDEDIIENFVAIPLVDPISKTRMLTPVRSVNCTHIDSFDLDSFFALNNVAKIKLRSRRSRSDLRNLKISLQDRLNPYLKAAPANRAHKVVNQQHYVMLKLENKYMGRCNNNLRVFTCPICDVEFDIFKDLYNVDFLQQIIVELNEIVLNKVPKTFEDVYTNRTHNFDEITHIVINRDGTYNYHVRDEYKEQLASHELVELEEGSDDAEELSGAGQDSQESFEKGNSVVEVPKLPIRKKPRILIELSESEDELNEPNKGLEDNPILIDD